MPKEGLSGIYNRGTGAALVPSGADTPGDGRREACGLTAGGHVRR